MLAASLHSPQLCFSCACVWSVGWHAKCGRGAPVAEVSFSYSVNPFGPSTCTPSATLATATRASTMTPRWGSTVCRTAPSRLTTVRGLFLSTPAAVKSLFAKILMPARETDHVAGLSLLRLMSACATAYLPLHVASVELSLAVLTAL